MKISVDQIRKIIKEEIGQMTQAPRKPVATRAAGKKLNPMLGRIPGNKSEEG